MIERRVLTSLIKCVIMIFQNKIDHTWPVNQSDLIIVKIKNKFSNAKIPTQLDCVCLNLIPVDSNISIQSRIDKHIKVYGKKVNGLRYNALCNFRDPGITHSCT